jgi:serine/threonine protein kinase
MRFTKKRTAYRNLLLEDAFGKVYRADILGGTHALRVLNSGLYNRSALDTFLVTAAQLNHAHLVPLKGASPDRGLLLHDMPESGNLLYILQTGVLPTTERLAWNSCVDIALAAASALQYLHNQPEPVAHGSLNAAMVYFDRNAIAKVGGAGLVQLCDKSATDSKALLLKDLYSLGVFLLRNRMLSLSLIACVGVSDRVCGRWYY